MATRGGRGRGGPPGVGMPRGGPPRPVFKPPAAGRGALPANRGNGGRAAPKASEAKEEESKT